MGLKMIIPLETDCFLAFDKDGEYLTLFLDDPAKDARGRWFLNDLTRMIETRKVGSVEVLFDLGSGKILSPGQKATLTKCEWEVTT